MSSLEIVSYALPSHNSSLSRLIWKDLTSVVRKVGTYYIAIGEYADLWDGELVDTPTTRQKRVRNQVDLLVAVCEMFCDIR